MKDVRDRTNNDFSQPELGNALPERSRGPRVVGRALRSPLLLLWILAGVCLVGGIIEWMFLDRSPWEVLGGVTLIASVTEIVARVKRVPAWPWRSDPSS